MVKHISIYYLPLTPNDSTSVSPKGIFNDPPYEIVVDGVLVVSGDSFTGSYASETFTVEATPTPSTCPSLSLAPNKPNIMPSSTPSSKPSVAPSSQSSSEPSAMLTSMHSAAPLSRPSFLGVVIIIIFILT
eukprot:11983365-Ditylum_brightwellii.AAC.1